MDYLVKIGDKEYAVSIDPAAYPPRVKLNGQSVEMQFSCRTDNSKMQLLIDNRSYDVEIVRQGSGRNGDFNVFVHGHEFSIYAEDERLAKIRKVAGMGALTETKRELRAPIPGLIARILKKPGQQVIRGESLIIVEAMKMENELKAPIDGIIREIKIKEGQSVDKNSLLIVFE